MTYSECKLLRRLAWHILRASAALHGAWLPPAAAPLPHMGQQTIREYVASKVTNETNQLNNS
jgi:hypothetical protein